MALECSGVYQHSFTFWSVTLQPLAVDQSTISHMKGNKHSFHMRYRIMICYHRLQSYGSHNNLNPCPLVFLQTDFLPLSVHNIQRMSEANKYYLGFTFLPLREA